MSPYDAIPQEVPSPKEAAAVLLLEGEALINEGRFHEALPKLDASLKLYRSPRTLLRKATSLFKIGRFVEAESAAAEARDLAQKEAVRAKHAKDTPREEQMAEWADEADKLAKSATRRLSRLTILVPSAALAQKPTVQYQDVSSGKADVAAAKTLGPSEHNHMIKVDPGHYRVISRAPGMDAWAVDVYPTGGDHLVVTLPALARAKALNAVPADGSGAVGAYALVGVGITGMVVGAIVGALVIPSKVIGSAEATSVGASLLLLGLGATSATIGAVWLASEPAQPADPSVAFGVGPTSAAFRVRF